ncbi:MAG: ergothioneine biosynthesis protein EgtB [Cyclobacteriaceae bacterium]
MNGALEPYITTEKDLLSDFKRTRAHTKFLCETLEIEDFVVQPVVDVSPLKWHLGHTTWFFENFVLVPNVKEYTPFHPKFNYLFNSYYVAAGERWKRANRGQLTRPTVREIFKFREYVEDHMLAFMNGGSISVEMEKVIELGIHHEQQHQELFLYDIKRILGDNPLNPVFREPKAAPESGAEKKWLKVEEGTYEIGFKGNDFHFDNEKGLHKVFLHEYEIESGLVTNEEYMEFMDEGGYESFQYWYQEAWDWVNNEKIHAPRYWAKEDGEWWHYTLGGYEKVNPKDPVSHVSFYEADAFARWKGCRLPSEQEWEAACKKFSPEISNTSNFVESKFFKPIQVNDSGFYGNLWEWTSSPYTAYPYFKIAEGALGEYNGKFMVNQMVLRGGSFATPKNHIRLTYRNFFHPHLRWLFSGIRLAKHTV